MREAADGVNRTVLLVQHGAGQLAEPDGFCLRQFTTEEPAVTLPEQAKRTTAFAEGEHATTHPSWRQHFEEIVEDLFRYLVFATGLEPRRDRLAVDRDSVAGGMGGEKLPDLGLPAAFD